MNSALASRPKKAVEIASSLLFVAERHATEIRKLKLLPGLGRSSAFRLIPRLFAAAGTSPRLADCICYYMSGGTLEWGPEEG